MDDFTAKKLEEWGLQSYIEDFKQKKIGEKAFLLLSNIHIEVLIPSFGDQLIFSTQYAAFKEQLSLQKAPDNLIVVVPHESDLNICELDADIETATSSVTKPQSPNLSHESVALRCVISTSASGTLLLSLKRRLREKERRQISEIIVNNFLKEDPKLNITKTQFIKWADSLSEIFVNDAKVVWYTPLVKSINGTFPAQGALLRAYYSFRKFCAEVNDEELSGEEDEDKVAANNELMLEAAGDLLWLSTHLEPWATVTEKWRATIEQRKLERDSSGYQINEYIDKYKVLRQPNGYLLLLIDFEVDYPDCSNKLYNSIDHFVALLFQELKKQRPMPRDLKRILNSEDLSVKAGGKLNSLVVLMNLMYLVPSQSIQKTSKCKETSDTIKGWKPTKQEIQNGFITLIDDVSKLQETLDRRDKKLKDVKLTRQPLVILVGRDINNIQASYVSINDMLYLLTSPIEAIDICFKSIFALNALYSKESRPLWMLLQFLVYGIKTKSDRKNATPSTLSLLSRFNINLV